MKLKANLFSSLRFIAAAGIVAAISAPLAVAQPPKAARPAPVTPSSQTMTEQDRRAIERQIEAMGPELTPEIFKLKELLASSYGPAPTGLRGPGPANDLCTGATNLNAAPINLASGVTVTVNDDNTTATTDVVATCGFTNTSQSSGAFGLWYKFTGTGNFVNFSTCQQATDMTIRIFCGDCTNLICIGADDDGCVTNSVGSSLGVCTTPGVQYFALIARYGVPTTGAPFAFTVTDGGTPCGSPACAAPPANDDCTGAQLVTIGSTVRGNDAYATPDTGLPACGTVTNNGVWFKVVGDGSILRASTCNLNTGSNSIIAVFSGACGALACVTNNAGLAGCVASPRDDTAQVDFTVPNGQTYFIWVAADANGAGEFSLSVTSIGQPVANDLCDAAITVAVPSSANFSNIGATADTVPCGGTNSTGVWFKLTGNGHALGVSTCGAGTVLNTKLGVYSGPCAALVCVDFNATAAPACTPTTAATVNFCSLAGTTYFVLVSGDTTGFGAFDLSVTDLGNCASNDLCTTATPLTIGVPVIGNNIGATNEPTLPTCNALTGFNLGVWYSVTGNGHVLQATTCDPNTQLNTRVYVYTGSCAAPVCVDANATASPACTPATAATAQFCSVNGQPYFILVTNDTTGTGQFGLTVIDAGACLTNDVCTSATTVALPSSTAGNNIGATNEPTLPTCTALTGFNNGVWYKFTGNGNRVSASTCDPATSLNTRVYVYTTPDCVNFTCVGANATAVPACTPTTAATVSFCSQADQVYYVLITNDTTGVGTFQLVISDLGPAGCVPTGACCLNGQCTITTQAACAGSYLGNNVQCNPSQLSPNLTFPDNIPAGVDSTLVVPPGGAPTITDLNVSVIVTHTYQGDLRITLTHTDTATTVVLLDRPGVPQDSVVGFAADNLGNPPLNIPFTFDDGAAGMYDSPNGPNCPTSGPCAVAVGGVANPTGTWKPEQPLAAFNGQSLAGTWVLNISDNAGVDTGSLNFWSLDSTPAAPSPCPTGPDCFTRGAAGVVGQCPPILTHNRPTANGHWTRGGADGSPDSGECMGDWDGNGCVVPSDVASFVTAWLYSAQNPGNLDGDIDCNNEVIPSDVAVFVQRWFAALQNPAAEGC